WCGGHTPAPYPTVMEKNPLIFLGNYKTHKQEDKPKRHHHTPKPPLKQKLNTVFYKKNTQPPKKSNCIYRWGAQK
ncbi:hypothetical protein, partial [Enterobacter asburiae]